MEHPTKAEDRTSATGQLILEYLKEGKFID